ncbi:Rho GDP-dissociation inhibitor 1 [Holothuria leucospilota]|uniref:Rho GDP-dissociation inhibitor 1 n=1 Tax=Holothuria leucospilota TaxID=206669 RepID=A0A9Q1H6K8_HOLLE|nr:Rho GDP-dissociation inhibitor 1 [Holothuria leucospilota]
MTNSMENFFLLPCLLLLATSSIVQSQVTPGNPTQLQDDADPRNVVVEKMIFCSEGRNDIELDLTDDLDALKDKPITIKEGCEYKLQIVFKVKREIVAGLRLFQTTYRKGVRLDKSNLMVGSYGPKAEPQVFTTAVEEAPKGMVSRGHYTMKSKFTDDDKNVHLAWEWSFDIKKDWD